MSFIAEFELSNPLLRATVQAVPEMTIQIEDEILPGQQGPLKLVVWAFGDDFDAFEAALGADPTVDSFALLFEAAERHHYRINLSEEGTRYVTYQSAVRADISFLEVTRTVDGIQIRASVPSRDALFTYRDWCRENDIQFRLRSIYREENFDESQFGITRRQYDALRAAFREGYFEVPRETTLAELADELGISDQALSARLRRGHANILRNTIGDEDNI